MAKEPLLTQLAKAFRAYAEVGMDDIDQVEQVLAGIYNAEYARQIRTLIEEHTNAPKEGGK